MARKQVGFVELQWKCPRCGSLNPGSKQVCANCGAPQPKDVKFEQAPHQELIKDESILAKAAAGPDIHCPYCGTRNSAGTKVCKQCGGDLSEGALREAGQVVGAYSFSPATTIKCPRCSTENPDTAKSCSSCGASLDQDTIPEATVAKPVATPTKMSVWVIVAVVAAIVVCGGIILLSVLSNRTTGTTGVVENVRWERVIPIEALVPVEYETWQDQLPEDAVIGACREEIRSIESEPAPNSVEVCGTPYTVDTGGGYGEVVQDCEYQVYDDLCSYTVEEWRQVDVALISGTDLQPSWPDPVLEAGERISQNRSETYTIVLSSGDQTFTYTTSDLSLFQQAQIGEQWGLNVNTFGKLISVEP